MKTIPVALQAHYDQDATTTCHLFKLRCKDGTVLGYTDLDADLVYDDGNGPVTYVASNGMERERLQSTADMSVDNTEVGGAVADAGVTMAQIRSGLFDYARVWLYRVNYLDLAAGHEIVGYGTAGETTFEGERWRTEFRSLTQQLRQPLSKLYSLTCRARFGDAQCGKALVWVDGVVSEVDAIEPDRLLTAAELAQADGYFAPGVLEITSGPNAGAQMDVDGFTAGAVNLALPLAYPLTVGTTFRIRQDCDKAFATCKGTHDNVLNFRGEPYIPISDGGANLIPGAQL